MMNPNSVIAKAGVMLGCATILMVSGCGSEPASMAVPATRSIYISGNAHGGEQPIQNASVEIYETQPHGVAQSSGYYLGTASLIGSTTTDSNGNFNFSSLPSCTEPNQVYLVASGGNSGSGTNSNILLMAAIGDCSLLTTSTFVDVDEVTTIAAAYALNRFTSISGTTVNVTSSATNYAGTASGTMTVSYSGTPSNAAGLAHAFLNAKNLANTINGSANSTVPGDSGSVVPSAVINSLASILQSCVNSTGGVAGQFSAPTTPSSSAGATATLNFISSTATVSGPVEISLGGGTALTGAISGATASTFVTQFNSVTAFSNAGLSASVSGNVVTVKGPAGSANTLSFSGTSLSGGAGDGSGCGQLFAATTPPNGTAPTNTLQAAINISLYPAYNAAILYSFIPVQAAFQPTINGYPNDWVIGISYPPNTTGINQTASLLSYFLTLDANDNVYADILYPSTSATSSCLAALTSSGTLLSGTGWDCSVGQSASALRQLAADQNGYIWLVNSSASPNNGVQQITASSGMLGTLYKPSESSTHTPQAIAVDKKGDIWFNTSGSGAALSEIILSGSAYSISSTTPIVSSSSWTNALGIAIDASQNVWGANGSTSSGTRYMTVYSPTNGDTAANTTNELYENAYGVAIDQNGYGWVPNEVPGSPAYYQQTSFAYTSSSNSPTVVEGGSGQDDITNSTVFQNNGFAEVDGANNLIVAQRAGSGFAVYGIATNSSTDAVSMPGATLPYRGCLATTSSDCHSSTDQLFNSPWDLQIDSTGSIWLTGGKDALGGNSNIVQVIGGAAPTWPLLAVGKPAVMP